jgi:RNA polymerase sigma factor (sigma-70 family)
MAITRLGTALRQIQRLFSDGTGVGLTDAQLWERFATERDASAFEALVERHGRTVLAVCRNVLHDPNDAEDIFQATFLVLLRKAGSLWTVKGSLGSWLHGVAYRIAIEANRGAARRREMERRAREMVNPKSGCAEPGCDILPALHEEIGRLPAKYRAPIVLCHLEEMTHAEAAYQLGWTVGMVRGRVSRARELLRARLTRRGLMLSGGVLITVLSEQAALAAVPRAWMDTMVGVATKVAAGQVAVGAVSAAAVAFSERMSRSMGMTRLIWAAAALLAAGGAAGIAMTLAVRQNDDGKRTHPGATPLVSRAKVAAAKAEDGTKPVPIRGRVLDWAGKPVHGATVYVRHSHWGEMLYESRVEPVAQAGPDGRFRFDLDPVKSDASSGEGPPWHNALIAAVAPGHGPTWISAGIAARGGAELRLVEEGQPIRGHILDTQGRGVRSARVRVKWLAMARDGVDLEALLASGKLDFHGIRVPTIESNWQSPVWIGREGEVMTDDSGRFEIKGMGRDQVTVLGIEGPGMEHAHIAVLDRTPRNKNASRPRRRSSPPDKGNPDTDLTLYGAQFEHVVGPSKPITGIVRLKGTGRPLSDVPIAGQIPGKGWAVMTKTDKDGRYRLEGLPKAQAYSLDVQTTPGSPYLEARTVVTDTAGLRPINVAFDLARAVGVTGRVIDRQTGRAVRCEFVVYKPFESNPDQAISHGKVFHSDNTFRITVPPGEGMIAVKVSGTSHPYPGARLAPADKGNILVKGEDGAQFGFPLSFYNTYRFVEFPAGVESATIDLEVTPGISRKVELIGPDGQPVTGARALGLSSDPFGSAVIEGATFEVNGLHSDELRQVEIRHEGQGLAGSATVEGSKPTDRRLIIKLARCGIIAGRLIDEDNQPLRGAKVSAGIAGRGLRANDPAFWNREAVTDAEGRFRIQGINPTLIAYIEIQDPNHPAPKYQSKLERDLRGLVAKPGAVLDLGDVRVRPTQIQ